jgi:hypothetical protein
MTIEIDTDLLKKKINFDTKTKKLNWIKSLRPEVFVKVGTSILVEEQEMDQPYDKYIEKQVKLRKKRHQVAKRLAVSRRQSPTEKTG